MILISGFKNFECEDNNCVSPDSQKGLEWGTYQMRLIMMKEYEHS